MAADPSYRFGGWVPLTSYYNENNAFAAQWLRNLIDAGHIAPGEVDERDIRDVTPGDLEGFTQCHFFAGIGGWSYALRLAGWPDDRPVWTGSCPCQPHSSARRGVGGGIGDKRDLWPVWFRLIEREKPNALFGEQVPSKAWAIRVARDLQTLGYRIRGKVLPAFLLGADHARERFWFEGNANSDSESGGSLDGEVAGLPWLDREPESVPSEDGIPGRMGIMRAYGNAIVPQVAAEFILSTCPG